MSQAPLVRTGTSNSDSSYAAIARNQRPRSPTQGSGSPMDRPRSEGQSSLLQARKRGDESLLHTIASGVEFAAVHGRLSQSLGPHEQQPADGEAEGGQAGHEELGEDDPPDNSPYPQVRASVPATDNISLSISTPRMWTLSVLFALLGSASNLFFSLRYPSVTITPVVALILVHPLGRIWDFTLKRGDDADDRYENGVRCTKAGGDGSLTRNRLRLWLAQGQWNEKEHACVYISSNVSFGFAFATDVIVEQHKFYNQEVSIVYQLLLTISTQILGYAFAGMARSFLVKPPSMIWPGTLMSASMFGTMHKSENKPANGWTISRWRFFIYVWAGSLIWYFVPGLLMPALSYFNVLTWFAPNSVTIANLFGVSSGLGLFPLTFDWAQLAYIGSPLLTPWWAAANVFAGLAIVMWIIAPILYYQNALYSAFMPIVSSVLFDNTGKPYDVTRILTPDYLFDEEKFQSYSPIYLPVTYMLSYAVQFASLTALITHTSCWYGKDILAQTKESLLRRSGKTTPDQYEPVRSEDPSVASHGPSSTFVDATPVMDAETSLRGTDVHNRLMEHYDDVPSWWYALTGILMLAIGIFVVEYYPVHLPWYGLFLTLGLTAVMFLPIAIIMAITNQHSSLYLIGQIFCGYVFPGRPIANMVFTTFLYISSSQGVKFSSDLKLGHYMKIPPKILFNVQVIATLVSSFAQIGVLNWMFVNIEGICTPQAVNGFNCPLARVHFNGSILWGVIGPHRFFGTSALYRHLTWAFVIGAICPVVIWAVAKRAQIGSLWKINLPLLFGSLSWIPPATGLNFSGWTLICFIFNCVIARKASAWWGKYTMNLSAALDSGLAFGLLAVFFAFVYPGITKNFHWWGTEIFKQGCDWQACPLYGVAEGEHFGPP